MRSKDEICSRCAPLNFAALTIAPFEVIGITILWGPLCVDIEDIDEEVICK